MIPPSLIFDSYPTLEFKFERGNMKPGGLQKMNRQIRQYKIEFQMQWHELLMVGGLGFRVWLQDSGFKPTQKLHCAHRCCPGWG